MSNRFPILHVLCSMRQRDGGPVRAVLDLSAKALQLGYPSEILSFGEYDVPDNPFPRKYIHILPTTKWSLGYCYAPTLNRWLSHKRLNQYRAVVLHGMWLHPLWRTARACTKYGIPYACFPHGMMDAWSIHHQGLFKRLKKSLYWRIREQVIFQHASSIFFTAQRELDRSTKTFPLTCFKSILIPYGVDIQSSDQSSGIPDADDIARLAGCKYALFLGRLHPKKNLDFLIRAWATAKPPADWLLVIAGPSEINYLNSLKHLSTVLGVEHSVIFVGSVAGRTKQFLYQNAQWFLLPSRQENFGIAVLEAIAHGCPTAISEEVYLGDAFHERSEVLPLSATEWCEFIRTRMPNMSHRAQIAKLDKALILPRFEVSEVAREWAETLYSIPTAKRSLSTNKHYPR